MQPRTIAGRYTVERAVGRGGMGTVWLCRDEVLGRDVAVKQVGSMPGETASDVRRALREARSSAALNHPNVVSIFDAVEDGDSNWLVMEYVPSRTLAEVLEQEGPMSPERAAWIGVQAADGLAAAHARGTMHRDVKPSNILVADNDHVKITDFGIARTHGDAQLTSTGLITGTPAYFAPETARGEEPTMAADVWALGATLYAAVEGGPPYPEQGNALALLTTIATQASPLPRRAGVLTEAINRMMDRDPTARWSMADAAHVLRRVHDQAVADARPAQTAARTISLPVAAAAAASAAGGTSGGTPAAAVAAPSTPVEPTPAVRRRRRPTGLLLAGALLLAVLVAVGVVLLDRDDDTPAATDRAGDAGTTTSASTPSAEPADTDPASTPPPTETEPVETDKPDKPDKTDKPGKTDPLAGAGTGSVEEFGQSYYALLPGDTEAAYALLSPSYGISYDDYVAFWNTIDAVEVRGATAVDDTTVDVELTYTSSDGSTEDETHRLFLEQDGDGFTIVDDSAV